MQITTIIWIGVSLLLIAFFSGIEIAFISASRLGIELKKKQGKKSGMVLSRFTEDPSKFLGACLVGLNIFLVVYGLLFSELMSSSLWHPVFHTENEYLRLGIDTLVSSVIVLVFGEFLPKAIFRAKNDSLLGFFAPVAELFYNLFNPLSSLFVSMAEGILKYLFDVRVKDKGEPFSKIDLEHFFQQTREQDTDSSELNTELFENALSLPSVKIRQCLVPRTEIEGLDISVTVNKAIEHFIETKLSKLLVYDGNIDNIRGYVHQLDMFKKPADLKSVLLPIPVVPETMRPSTQGRRSPTSTGTASSRALTLTCS